MSSRISPRAEAEVRRLITRFAIERIAAGWSHTDLAKEVGAARSNLIRAEDGTVIPTLPVLLTLAEPLGLRLDWVPAHLQPLLALDEFEIRALIGAGEMFQQGWTSGSWSRDHLESALTKVGSRV